MKKVSLFLALPVLLLGTYLFAFQTKKLPGGNVIKKTNAVTCSSFSAVDDGITTANGKFIIRLPGWGHYSYHISTRNDSAQFYFDQGLTMYYSYHLKEAFASFKEAARFDPSSPMTYWGQALSMGPYYNAANLYVVPKGLPAVLKQLNATANRATEKEKELIRVMNLRYPLVNEQTTNDNMGYAKGMKALISTYPKDQDIKTLYIDAMMLIHAWDFWTTDELAKEWTPELVDLCKGVLKTDPDHPGALHYYIHLTEASRNPEVALANAEGLKRNFPGVGHMVHMASHVYQRNGLYFQGVDANTKANKSVLLYYSIAKNVPLAKAIPHLFAVETYCALSGGMYEEGMDAALRCRNSVSPSSDDNYSQYLYMMPVLTMVRLGKWHEILKDNNAPDPGWTYAQVLNNFAKGLAFIYTGKRDSASRQLQLLRDKINDPVLKIRRIPFNTSFEGATIAENILDGAILLDRNKYDDGIACLKKAVKVEDDMIYAEPAEWPIPARQFLGAYLLKNGDITLAEQVYKEDLVHNPGNGWSLLGLYQSLKAQNRKEKLDYYKSGFLRSFSHADVVPIGSVFMN
jgi:tetratricopeptide (TPR) repeat protein